MKKTLIICSLVVAILCTGCANSESAVVAESSSKQASSSEIAASSAPVSSDVSSAVSSEIPSTVQESSAPTSSEAVTSAPPSSAVSSKVPKVESKVQVSSKAPATSKTAVSSQPLTASSEAEAKIISESTTNFGELMDEAVVDAIIAEGIEYANSKGYVWDDSMSIDESGYYNPPFSGHGEEIFRRDLLYNIDQLMEIALADAYWTEENVVLYKIVKGEFSEKGYWFGFVLY